MIKYYGVCQDMAGNALPGATAQIKNFLTGANAPIYQDDGATPKSNPITADSTGRFWFKAASGVYDIVTVSGVYTSTESEITIAEDSLVAYFVNNHGSSLVYGDLVRITGSGQVQKAVSNGTEAAAGVEAVCVETLLTNGSTGRFRLLGPIDKAGTAGAYGYLSATGTITTTVPSAGAGDTYLCVAGKFISNTLFNFKPGYPTGIF